MCFTRIIFVAMWRRDGIEVRLGIGDTYLTDQVVLFIRKIFITMGILGGKEPVVFGS